MYEDMVAQHIDSWWFLPIIQGFIHIEKIEVLGQSLTYSLISRRRYLHAGTRFNARGITDSGNCANFVETEQIIIKEK